MAVCEWHGDDALDVHISTQWIWGVRDDVAEAFGLAPDKVRVVCEYMGGGFGSKNGAGDYTLIAAELARRTDRPVKLRADAPRGEPRHRQPQRDRPAARRRRDAPTAR